jgi:NIMA (never in mitosis gene a)-related kinase 1/4/5
MKDKTIKLADFGVSEKIANAGFNQVTKGGTAFYETPEQIKGQPFDFKIDIWALGCVMYYMACKKAPFDHKSSKQFMS